MAVGKDVQEPRVTLPGNVIQDESLLGGMWMALIGGKPPSLSYISDRRQQASFPGGNRVRNRSELHARSVENASFAASRS